MVRRDEKERAAPAPDAAAGWGRAEDATGRDGRPARNPLSLSVRGARYGAVALALGLAVLAFPVWQGTRDGLPPEPPASDWDALRQFGRELAAPE